MSYLDSRLSLRTRFMEKTESLSTELVNLTREMIRIRSENPPGDEMLPRFEAIHTRLDAIEMRIPVIEKEAQIEI